MQGLSKPGVAFYSTTFDLNMPTGYDIPLSFAFTNATSTTASGSVPAYRAQIYVNGYQFGKYVSREQRLSLAHILIMITGAQYRTSG